MNRPTQPTPGLRERVAELRGWVNIVRPGDDAYLFIAYHADDGAAEIFGRNLAEFPDGLHHPIPDYPGDLNHAHAACRALLVTDELWHAFSVIVAMYKWPVTGWTDWRDTRALLELTPTEICILLLRTLGGEEGATEPPKCGQCNGEGCPSHECPYACDINEDYESRCTCCEGCQGLCAMEI